MLTSRNIKVAVLDIQPLTYQARKLQRLLILQKSLTDLLESTITDLRQDRHHESRVIG